MPRTVKDSALDTRTARARLKVRGKPYYRLVEHGLHLGYRRSKAGGRWVARIYLGGEAYRVETLATADDASDADATTILSFAQAQALARKRHQEITRVEAGEPKDLGPYTVAKAIDAYVQWLEHEGRTDRAVKDARRAMDAHAVPKLGSIRLDRITTHQIKSWLAALAKAPPRLRVQAGKKQRFRDVDMADEEVRRQRQSAANRILNYLKAALNLAWRSEKVASDKAWRAVKPFRNADASRMRYFTIAECRALIAACEDDFGELLQAALHTGARFSELARLVPADFNGDVGTIAVRKSKSGKPRHVVLTDEGRVFFAALLKRGANRQFLFVRADGAQWKASWQVRPMRAACKAAGIDPAGFHICRHTWASHSLMNGAPLLVVARNLGHKDTRMVEKHYGHLLPTYEADAIRATAPRFGVLSQTGPETQ